MRSGLCREDKLRWKGTRKRWFVAMLHSNSKDKTSSQHLRHKPKKPEKRFSRSSKKKKRTAELKKNSKKICVMNCT
jgi:hypothetical protein